MLFSIIPAFLQMFQAWETVHCTLNLKGILTVIFLSTTLVPKWEIKARELKWLPFHPLPDRDHDGTWTHDFLLGQLFPGDQVACILLVTNKILLIVADLA